ncbi:hypothetical protein OG896_01860 [Streptomyces sp. NBC_00669]|uniref:hypothetical protein n=1 Tax=Streptomyces sp. NBC_00669 TaxID=2976011 RepID=UPI002E33223F|nr:hypothetical protein [Streptomyces sp. NBC_00669]
MGTASEAPQQPVHGGMVAGWLSKVFELNPAGINWPRAVMFLDVALVPLVVFWTIGHEQYLLGSLFGLLLAMLDDPGGGFGHRVSRIAVFALIGAGVTALGFGIGADAWGWLVLAAFAVTLVSGLAVAFGVRRFVTALLLVPAGEHGLRLFAVTRGLEVVALVLLMHGAAIRFWNYALYCAAIAAGVLILVDLPQPSDYAAEGYRMLWTLCGVGIGLLVMLLAGLLAKRTAKAPPRPA